MGNKFQDWVSRSSIVPENYIHLTQLILDSRNFTKISKLEYGDYGLNDALEAITTAIAKNKRIALYADYDVDGTMSCVSWVWFFQAIGYKNFLYYIPDRFTEGYGVNLQAVKHLVEEQKAEVIITMDTGITANEEARWCKEHGVVFICTDHHKIQSEKMPDCIILNPKMHPDPHYQELCGCGITFVLLRRLGETFPVSQSVWTDILALTGMATICDVVPLNGVNHRIAQHGVQALLQSERSVLQNLLRASSVMGDSMDEKDVGFRLGPRINAVGRLEHALKVIEAFVHDDPTELVQFMGTCNERRKKIQVSILEEAKIQAKLFPDAPVLFLGGKDWHQGVVGIAASKIAEEFWRPVWLFQRGEKLCKGSARSIAGFDVTEAMQSCSKLFVKFGGHRAAGGFSFLPENEEGIRSALIEYATKMRAQSPHLWNSTIYYDCKMPFSFLRFELAKELQNLRPFGHAFEEPLFLIEGKVDKVQFYNDKALQTPKHTALFLQDPDEESGRVPGKRSYTRDQRKSQKVMFFNQLLPAFEQNQSIQLLVGASCNYWQGQASLSLQGVDYSI